MSYEKFTEMLGETGKATTEGNGDGREQLNRFRMILHSAEKYGHPIKHLERQWQEAETARPDVPGMGGNSSAATRKEVQWVGLERTSLTESALVAFVTFINLNRIPPPEILLAVGEMFSKYLQGDGKLTLSEAFFGSNLNKDSLAKEEYDKYVAHQFDIALFKNNGLENPLSQEEVAESIAGNGKGLNIEPKNIIQKWRRHKQRK